MRAGPPLSGPLHFNYGGQYGAAVAACYNRR